MKKEYLLLVVVIIGLGALLFYQKKGRTNYQLPALSVLEKRADRLLIEKADELVDIRLVDGKWVLGTQHYRANTARIEKMVSEVKELKLTALISDKANYQLYELSPDKRLKVTLFKDDQILREIQIGKSSASLRQTYVMLKDDPKVYQALGNLKSNFFTSIADLRDKKVLEIAGEKLAGLDEIVLDRLEDGEHRLLKLVRVKSEPVADDVKSARTETPVISWQQESGVPVATDAVDRLLKNISTLQCESFIEDRQPEAFINPLYRIVIKGGGEEYSLSLLAPEDNKYPAISSYSQQPFWLPSWRAEKIIKEFSVNSGSSDKAESK